MQLLFCNVHIADCAFSFVGDLDIKHIQILKVLMMFYQCCFSSSLFLLFTLFFVGVWDGHWPVLWFSFSLL